MESAGARLGCADRGLADANRTPPCPYRPALRPETVARKRFRLCLHQPPWSVDRDLRPQEYSPAQRGSEKITVTGRLVLQNRAVKWNRPRAIRRGHPAIKKAAGQHKRQAQFVAAFIQHFVVG